MIGLVSSILPQFVFVCVGPTCGERGGASIHAAWKQALLQDERWSCYRAVPVRCFGECATGPNAACPSRGVFLRGMAPANARGLLSQMVENAEESAVRPTPA